MLLIYLIVNYLCRKYGVPLHNFSENWTSGISHLKEILGSIFSLLSHPIYSIAKKKKKELLYQQSNLIKLLHMIHETKYVTYKYPSMSNKSFVLILGGHLDKTQLLHI